MDMSQLSRVNDQFTIGHSQFTIRTGVMALTGEKIKLTALAKCAG
jgi:hypothetical protein